MSEENEYVKSFKGFFVALPFCVARMECLDFPEMVILSEIAYLSSLKDGCFKTNAGFAKQFGTSERIIKRTIKSLSDNGFIVKNLEKKGSVVVKRKLSLRMPIDIMFGESVPSDASKNDVVNGVFLSKKSHENDEGNGGSDDGEYNDKYSTSTKSGIGTSTKSGTYREQCLDNSKRIHKTSCHIRKNVDEKKTIVDRENSSSTNETDQAKLSSPESLETSSMTIDESNVSDLLVTSSDMTCDFPFDDYDSTTQDNLISFSEYENEGKLKHHTNKQGVNETSSELEKESQGQGQKEKEKGSAKKEREKYSEDFEQAWAEYPRRAGSNNKKKAFSCWKARLKEGHTAEEMIEGTIAYRENMSHNRNIDTPYVMQATRFYGTAKEFLVDWEIPSIHNTERTRVDFKHEEESGFSII